MATIKMERYPPLVKNFLPSLIREEYNNEPNSQKYLIAFALSSYDSIPTNKEVRVQIALRNQKTNSFALKKELHPTGFKIGKFGLLPNAIDDYKYYVTIFCSDLQNNNFELNQSYKLQLRFMKPREGAPQASLDLANEYYTQPISEWSQTCLIKVIDKPVVSIHGLSENEPSSFSAPFLDLIGNVSFSEGEKEYLKSYKLQLFEEQQLVLKTDDIFTNQYNPNEFSYNLGYQLNPEHSYKLNFIYTTSGFYKGIATYNFSVYKTKIGRLKANILAQPDNINGVIRITIKGQNAQRLIGNITIRRSSSKDNFQKWEDIQNFVFTKSGDLNWIDLTAESGIWYKYCAQKRGHNGQRGAIIETQNPVMCVFEDMFLVQQGTMLNIKFNPSISNFKYNITESQQNTLGSKYPYFTRNGDNYYRTFSIGGLISAMADNSQYLEENIIPFASKKNIFQNSVPLYEAYYKENNINDFNNFIYEKNFRDKIYEFLYKNKVKLFKSTTQGNILIKLTDINFQPNSTLGRKIYSFTATAVQIDEANIENYNKYQIQTVGEYSKNLISFSYSTLGQIPINEIYAEWNSNTNSWAENTNGGHVIRLIRRKYNNWNSHQGYTATLSKLKWIRFEFTSPPLALREDGDNGIIKVETGSNLPPTMAGYVVKINEIEFLIPSTMQRYENKEIKTVGSFEIGEPININSVLLKYPAEGTFDYIAEITETEQNNLSLLNSSISPFYTLGQLYQTFYPNQSVINIISNKYQIRSQTLIAVLNIKIEAPQGTILYIKDSKDRSLNYHILQNGFLKYDDKNVFIEDLYLFGLHFYEHPKENITTLIKNNEFFIVEGTYSKNNNETYDSIIPYKIKNGVYYIPSAEASIENQQTITYSNGVQETFDGHYIYYNNTWWAFSKNHNIIYDVNNNPIAIDGIIDYCCEIY